MRGGKPGFYPEIKGKGGPGGHFLLNLWDVLGNVEKMSPEKKERGLKVEILNGRAARPPRPRPLLFTSMRRSRRWRAGGLGHAAPRRRPRVVIDLCVDPAPFDCISRRP